MNQIIIYSKINDSEPKRRKYIIEYNENFYKLDLLNTKVTEDKDTEAHWNSENELTIRKIIPAEIADEVIKRLK
jgi:hypothetical protein